MGKSWKRLGILANTQKKSRVLTKLTSEISVATRLGGKDPQNNARLRLAVELAKRESCPKETIERAILRGAGELDHEKKVEELFYEGYGPHGVAFIFHAQTDNRTRTVAEIRSLFKRQGGSLGETGSVQWLFHHCCQITAHLPQALWAEKSQGWDPEEEAIEVGANGVEEAERAERAEKAMEAGEQADKKAMKAEKAMEAGEQAKKKKWLFWGEATDVESLRENLEKRGWILNSMALAFRAKEMLSLPPEQTQKVMEFWELLQNNSDCYALYTNCQL